MDHHHARADEKNVYVNSFQGLMVPPALPSLPPNSNSYNPQQPPPPHLAHLINNSTYSSSAITSSTSSERALIHHHHHSSSKTNRLNLPYCLLVFAILFLTLALISIAITFIFPFWIRLTLQSNNSNSNSNASTTVSSEYLNVTNAEYGLSLLTMNYTDSGETVPSVIVFDLGLWEVKMQQELEFYDLNSRTVVSMNMYPQTMLWLSGDVNNYYQSFLIKLLQFIDLKGSLVFLIQVLEIVHIIFVFLTLSFTSYTLCLCSNHRLFIYLFDLA
jgi:hypothetical protein